MPLLDHSSLYSSPGWLLLHLHSPHQSGPLYFSSQCLVISFTDPYTIYNYLANCTVTAGPHQSPTLGEGGGGTWPIYPPNHICLWLRIAHRDRPSSNSGPTPLGQKWALG